MYENIPAEIQASPCWLAWKTETRENGNVTKVPINVKTGLLGDVTNPDHWTDFVSAVRYARTVPGIAGIGYAFHETLNKESGIDLDASDDPDILARQALVFKEFESYTERSPSGKGYHIIIKGKIPSGRRRDKIEIYSHARFFTFTGDVVRNLPIAEYEGKARILWEEMGKAKDENKEWNPIEIEDRGNDLEIWTKAKDAANGEKFLNLWNGNWNSYYQSQSEADFALIDIIAFYSRNPHQIHRMFMQSGLGQREKAQRFDYVHKMIRNAFDRITPPLDIEHIRNKLNEQLARTERTPAFIPLGVGEGEGSRGQAASSSVGNALAMNGNASGVNLEIETEGAMPPPPGFVGKLAAWIYADAFRPVPEYATAAALALMAGVCGRAWNVSNVGLNLYILAVGETGTGKEGMASAIQKAKAAVMSQFQFTSFGQVTGPGSFASAQGLIRHLSSKDGSLCFVSVLGECGYALEEMAQSKNPTQIALQRLLLDLYSKSGKSGMIEPTVYSDREKNTDPIQRPAVTLLGEGVGSTIYGSMDERAIERGLISRFLIIENKSDRAYRNPNAGLVPLPQDIAEHITALYTHSITATNQGHIFDVQLSPEAKEVSDMIENYCDAHIIGKTGAYRQLWNRTALKVLKVAAILAVCDNPMVPTISLEHIMWAWWLCKRDTERITKKFERGEVGENLVVGNDVTQQLRDICQAIHRYITLPHYELKAYSVDPKIHDAKIVSWSVIRQMCSAKKSFRTSNNPNLAFKEVQNALIDAGAIAALDRVRAQNEFSTQAKLYVVTDFEWIDANRARRN